MRTFDAMYLHSVDLMRQLHLDRRQRLLDEFAPCRKRRRPPTRPTLTLVVTVPDAWTRRDVA